jgi:hypothetical protein
LTRLRIASLLVLTALQAGCSRTPDRPNAPSGATHLAKHTQADKTISQDKALELLISELKARKTPDLDCLAFQNESEQPAQSKAQLWDFAAREVHNARCGGDPAVLPIRDRYQISSAGKVWVYDAVTGQYNRL